MKLLIEIGGGIRCNPHQGGVFLDKNHELNILDSVLRSLKMNDVVVRYDKRGLIATDSWGNKWRDAEFYRFLISEAFVFTSDNEVLGLKSELYQEFIKFANNAFDEEEASWNS